MSALALLASLARLRVEEGGISVMRRVELVTAVSALLLTATPSLAANWIYVGTDAHQTALYYDPETVRRSGSQITTWTRQDYLNNDRSSDKEIRTELRARYDCTKRTVTFLDVTAYYPDGKNRVFTFKASEQITDTILPESTGEVMLKAICTAKAR
jgi:hypothetical protein